MRKQIDIIPSDLNEELKIRADAGSKLLKEMWGLVQRHLSESALTHWEVLGAMTVLEKIFVQEYLTEDNDDE